MKPLALDSPELPLSPPELTPDQSVNAMIWQIAGEIRRKRVSFFFGAGMSCSAPSNIPSGATLGGRIVNELFPERVDEKTALNLADAFPLEILAESMEMYDIYKRSGLDRFLTKQIDSAGSQTNAGHTALAGLAPYLTRIYTTNFDQLIERELGDGCVSAVRPQDLVKIDKAQHKDIPAILHLHGAVPGPYSITESELLTQKIPFLQFLNSDLMTHTFVFVGYSLVDPDFRPVYFEVMKTVRDNRELDKKTYIVSMIEQGLARDLAQKCWAARAFDLIPMDAGEFMQALRVAVRYYEHRDEFQEVATRMHGRGADPRTLANEIKSVTSRLADMEGEDVLDCLEELTRKGASK
jgi:hypothetical protein